MHRNKFFTFVLPEVSIKMGIRLHSPLTPDLVMRLVVKGENRKMQLVEVLAITDMFPSVSKEFLNTKRLGI